MRSPTDTKPERALRVLVADDRRLVRKGMRLLLADFPCVEVVSEAAAYNELRTLTRTMSVDVALVDVRLIRGRLGQYKGIACDLYGGARTIVLSVQPRVAEVKRVLASGASGFLLDRAAPVDLEDALIHAAAGRTFLCPSIIRAIVTDDCIQPPSGRNGPENEMTAWMARRECIQLVRQGVPLHRIPASLDLTGNAADELIAQLTRYTGGVRTEVLRKAVSSGVLSTDGETP